MDKFIEKIWEKQPYETDYQYNVFSVYLTSPKPRNLEKAFQIFKKETKAKGKRVPANWHKWSKGDYGDESGYTWAERVAKFELYIEEKIPIKEKFIEQQILEQEQESAGDMIKTWQTLFKVFHNVVEYKEDITPKDVKSHIRDLKELVQIKKNIDDMNRRANEVAINPEPKQTNKPVVITYEDNKKAEYDLTKEEIGEGYEELLDELQQDKTPPTTQRGAESNTDAP